MSVRRAYIGLGANLGDRWGALRFAYRALEGLGRGLRASSVYETQARFELEQPDFLNAVVALDTEWAPEALLQALLETERALGRVRDPSRPKGPRVLDLDLLLVGELRRDTATLTLPHPGLAERRFVLRPLLDVHPEGVHPTLGATFRALLERCDDDGEVRVRETLRLGAGPAQARAPRGAA